MRHKLSRPGELRRNRELYLMALPGMIFLLMFSYLPMPGLILAFNNYNFQDGIFRSPWVGFKNFDFFFGSDKAGSITFNTLYLNGLFIIFSLITQMGSAIFLNEIRIKKFKSLVQSVQFLPYFLSWIVISSLLFSLFSSELGSVNRILSALGGEPVSWYSHSEYWRFILVGAYLWKWTGYGTVIYLAAIAGIDGEYYEAARIDGAGRLQQMTRITIPLLTPTAIILTLLAVGRIFYGDFGMIYSIIKDNGLLLRTTEVIDTYVYRSMRMSGDISFASAVGLYQSLAGFLLVGLTNWLSKRYQGISLF